MDSLRTLIETVNGKINSFVWGLPMLILIVGTGILMTILTKGFQLFHFRYWIKNTIGSIFADSKVTTHTAEGDKQITQFQSLCTALAATIGTGNIAGVAAAIATGGPGAVFWMWIVAFIGMMTHFSENVLGIYYRRKNEDGEWCGGPMYYLTYGLGAKRGCHQIAVVFSGLFSIFCIIASFGIGNMTQINTIAVNMDTAFGIPNVASGIVVAIISGLVIIGGIKRIASVTEKLVPFMAILYIAGSLLIIITHINHFGDVLLAIIKGAFGMKAVGGGIVGSGIMMAAQWGMKRGVFSNEAGLGSSVMIHASSNVKEPVAQGMWGIFEVFTDTIVVCTMTAFAILSAGLVDLSTGVVISDKASTALVAEAFSTIFGRFGSAFIAIAILFFAFSSILGWSQYGCKSIEFLLGSRSVKVYQFIFVLFILIGASMDLTLAWDLSDTFNGLMAIPNLIALITLSGTVAKITKNFTDRKMLGKNIKPMLSAFEEIQKEQEK